MEGSFQLHAKAALPPEELTPVIHFIGGSVDCRTGLDAVEKRTNLLPLLGMNPTPESSVVHPVA
jgi:hypothetical protein